MVVSNTKVVQVTNIAPQATKDQMQTLFGYLGKIEDIRLYPTIRDVSCPVQSRICYVKFMETATVGIAQHMTNTVFIDRALIVIPVQSGDIPDEYYALEMTRNGTIVPGLNVNEPKLPPHVVNSVQGTGAEQVIATSDPQLEANGLPPYPALPVNYDSVKVEETRRTVMVANIDPATPPEEIIEHFSHAGEVKYLRSCENPSDNSTHVLIEFSDQPSVIHALKMNGTEFKEKPLEIVHATQPIVKPQAKSNEAAQKEIEEAMSRFKEAQNMINASIEPVIGMLTKDKRSSRRSRSRSRGRRRRSRSRSRSRRSRSRRRRSTSRRRSRSRDRKKRSKSRSRKRSRSRSRRSRSRRSRSRKSHSKSPTKQRSRHKSKERESRDKDRKSSRDRSKERKRDKERKSKEKEPPPRSKEKSSRESKDKKSDKESSSEAVIEKKKSRSRSRSRRRSRSRDKKVKDKERKRSRSKGRRRTPSPRTSRKRSRSKSKERRRDKKDRKEKRERDRERDRSRSRSKVPRNYDEEEKGFDSEKSNPREPDSTNEKESSEKSDNMDISNSP